MRVSRVNRSCADTMLHGIVHNRLKNGREYKQKEGKKRVTSVPVVSTQRQTFPMLFAALTLPSK